MTHLFGEYECKLDPKGRLKVPSQLLQKLGAGTSHTFFLNRGFEPCVVMYPQRVWEQIMERVSKLNYYNSRERQFMREFLRGLKDVSTDSAERILINKQLLDHASIKSDVVLFACVNKIEIWDKDAYYSRVEDRGEDFADLANDIIGSPGFDFNL